ncbi:reelin-like [Lineus longissimus]|uniref:reelin-like n=1 Tax=Lineus longissimus TaxID=88925 RepID=UPI00315D2528
MILTTFFISLVIAIHVSLGMLPHVSPFFFVCNYHGNSDVSNLQTGEVSISVEIAGNPGYYHPGQPYQVNIQSSLNFDGFLLTGLYSMAAQSNTMSSLAMFSPLSIPRPGQAGQNFMCSIVHQHMSPRPTHQLAFMWMAPPKGTGCVKFLATATLAGQLLFKDTTVLQICEEGAPTKTPPRPPLLTLHDDGVIFRDDFDSGPDLSTDLWNPSRSMGVKTDESCGHVMHGAAAVFCEAHGERKLETVAINTTTAAVLQFALSAGQCSPSIKDKDIVVQYGGEGCSNWQQMDRIR